MKELLPCPFCGGEADYVDMGSNRLHIACPNCDCSYGEVWGTKHNKESLLKGWNARTEQMQINWDKIELECRKAGLIIELKSYQGDVNLNNDTRGTQYVAMRGIIDLIKKELRPKP